MGDVTRTEEEVWGAGYLAGLEQARDVARTGFTIDEFIEVIKHLPPPTAQKWRAKSLALIGRKSR